MFLSFRFFIAILSFLFQIVVVFLPLFALVFVRCGRGNILLVVSVFLFPPFFNVGQLLSFTLLFPLTSQSLWDIDDAASCFDYCEAQLLDSY